MEPSYGLKLIDDKPTRPHFHQLKECYSIMKDMNKRIKEAEKARLINLFNRPDIGIICSLADPTDTEAIRPMDEDDAAVITSYEKILELIFFVDAEVSVRFLLGYEHTSPGNCEMFHTHIHIKGREEMEFEVDKYVGWWNSLGDWFSMRAPKYPRGAALDPAYHLREQVARWFREDTGAVVRCINLIVEQRENLWF